MTVSLSTFLCLACLLVISPTFALPQMISKRNPGPQHLPLRRHTNSPGPSTLSRRGDISSSVGLGDDLDQLYSAQLQIGDSVVSIVLDTGSSDLWVVSDACQLPTCKNGLPLYSGSSFQSDSVPVNFFFGDSITGTHASGTIGADTVTIGGIEVIGQKLGSINDTTTTVLQLNAVGLLGLGFPTDSFIWVNLFKPQFPNDTPIPSHLLSSTNQSEEFPAASLSDALGSFATNGPLISRLSQNGLESPEFTVQLQRETFDVGGNEGLLSLGELPPGISNDSLTWVPVRLYTAEEGGLPSDSETYPLHWEIELDDIFIDGQLLPRTNLSDGPITALLDTGGSLIRGQSDFVASLNTMLSGSATRAVFDCHVPHTLALKIGGKMFPVDPRDFAKQAVSENLDICTSQVVSTDPPQAGFLFSFILGVPFLKGVVSSFYYGNLTHPSVDPPRIGLLSTVPSDANDQYTKAIAAAEQNGNVLPGSVIDPPGPATVFTTVNPSKPTAGVKLDNENSSSPPPSPSLVVLSSSSASNPLSPRKDKSAANIIQYSIANLVAVMFSAWALRLI